MTVYCKYCHKKWRLKTDYDKHITCCEYFYQLRRNPEMDDFGGKIPTQRELFRLVQDLATKCSNLDKEVSRLKNVIHTRNKKAIVDCLNHPAQFPPVSFSDWWREIAVNENHLETVFGGDLTDGIKKAIDDYLTVLNRESPRSVRLPIRAFIQKPNSFYIYMGRNSSEEGDARPKSPWKIMQNEDMECMVLHLSQLLLKEFLKWQKNNTGRQDEKSFEKELNYMMKINGTKTSSEKRIAEIKKWLFPKLHENMIDVTVEFV